MQLSCTIPSPSSLVNTRSAEGDITHSFTFQAHAKNDAYSCCVLWIKVKRYQLAICHSPAQRFLRMVARTVPHVEVYRPRLYPPEHSNPWSMFYSVRTHPGSEHRPNVHKQTRSTGPVNHSGYVIDSPPGINNSTDGRTDSST